MSAVLQDLPDVLTVDEAAECLRVSRSSIYQRCARNEIPHVRIGDRILIPRFRLEHWLRTGRDIPEARLRAVK